MGNRMQLKGLGGFVGGFRFKFNGNEKLPIKKRKKKLKKKTLNQLKLQSKISQEKWS